MESLLVGNISAVAMKRDGIESSASRLNLSGRYGLFKENEAKEEALQQELRNC